MSEVLSLFLRPAGEVEPPPVLKAASVRMPAKTLAYIDAMAEAADLSRNGMAVQLIEWGIQHALGELPDEIRDEIGESVEGPDYFHMKG